MRQDKDWYICEDSDTFFIGNSADLFDYLERRAVLPYIVFYQTCEDEPDETPKHDKTVHDAEKREEVIKSEAKKVKSDKVEELKVGENEETKKSSNQNDELKSSIKKSIKDNNKEEDK